MNRFIKHLVSKCVQEAVKSEILKNADDNTMSFSSSGESDITEDTINFDQVFDDNSDEKSENLGQIEQELIEISKSFGEILKPDHLLMDKFQSIVAK